MKPEPAAHPASAGTSGGGGLVLRGIGASPGVAIATAFVFERGRVRTPRYHLPPDQVEGELHRLREALARSDAQLAKIQGGVDGAAEGLVSGSVHLSGAREYRLILEAHQAMMRDEVFIAEVERLIRDERLNAEWAFRREVRRIKGALGESGDEYFRERRADLDFLADRVVRNLLGVDADAVVAPPAGCILVARDLSPADAAILLAPGRVAGLVTDLGGRTGHAALVARSREIPTVVGTGDASTKIQTGALVAVDGGHGTVTVRPAGGVLARLEAGRSRYLREEGERLGTSELPATTQDGVRIRLVGNVEFGEEAPSLWSHGAEGVGLYRTEFLYLDRPDLPTEEDHLRAYRALLTSAGARPVTIRTLDLGNDKVPGQPRRREANPAMGLRALRLMLRSNGLFRTQLRALLRASSAGNLRIMFPMVSGLTELREARAHLEAVRAELAREGEPMAAHVPVGIMIELPAAAAIADRLARECDFFSVGTNDLIQYAMAADRGNPLVSYLYRPLHLGILRTLDFVVRSAHEARIPVAMCGEMAGDPAHVAILLGLGFDELSMTAAAVPVVKRLLRALRADESRALLERAMQLGTQEEIERFVRDAMKEKLGALVDEG
ncbi:MAG: phosphoenolpyruvate--protein phosphotransferase [Deltaproteobacteria bacterium]